MNSRVERLRERLQDGQACYITSFANVFYYSGFTSEDASLLISHDKAVILTDSRYTVQAKLQCPDFEIYNIADGYHHFFSELSIKKLLYEPQDLTVMWFETLQKDVGDIELFPAQDTISSLREHKEEVEIAKIREAERLGDEAFSHLLTKLHVGMTELDAALILEFFMRSNGASALSFDTIAASGSRSAMPHGVATNKVIEQSELVTFDFGCVLDGYCSDMTRTVVMGQANERQREIYNIVRQAQEAALSAVRVGISCAEVDRAARDVIQSAGYGDCFGHSLGHSVGIEIHERPNFSPKSTAVVENGHVITVEPGIYIDGFGGVRIEDVIAVHNGIIENLTKSSKDLIIL